MYRPERIGEYVISVAAYPVGADATAVFCRRCGGARLSEAEADIVGEFVVAVRGTMSRFGIERCHCEEV